MAVAQQKVTERLTTLMRRLQADLRAKHTSWLASVLDAEAAGKEPPEPPTELTDLQSLAEQNGLEFQKTGELSFLDLRDTPIGKSFEREQFRQPLTVLVFTELEEYEPMATDDVDGNHYLTLKVSDTPGKIPELEEVREQVVREWKLQKAAELALARAEEHATEAEQAGATLEEFFADDSEVQVNTTDPFSWLTIGNISQTTGEVFFRLSEPEGMVAAGPAVMREIFQLEPGQVGAVLNHDRSIAYVLRTFEHLDSGDQLRRDFLNEANRWYGLRSMSRFHNEQAARALVSDMLATSNVDWLRWLRSCCQFQTNGVV